MIIKFCKYQGTGNDFIIIDNRHLAYEFSPAIVEQLCHRKFGIGADGFMLLENCEGYDFRMRYFNADGKEATLCGNGARCMVAFAHRLKIFQHTTCFLAADGPHQAEIRHSDIRLKMNDVRQIRQTGNYFFLDTGSPHYVEQVENAFQMNIVEEGRKIRYATIFQPEGTNVNFMTPVDGCLQVATYERGVENETLSCGTGCVAAALSLALLKNDTQNTYTLQTKGGRLKVSFKRQMQGFTDIWLEGPAGYVFSGSISLTNLSPLPSF